MYRPQPKPLYHYIVAVFWYAPKSGSVFEKVRAKSPSDAVNRVLSGLEKTSLFKGVIEFRVDVRILYRDKIGTDSEMQKEFREIASNTNSARGKTRFDFNSGAPAFNGARRLA